MSELLNQPCASADTSGTFPGLTNDVATDAVSSLPLEKLLQRGAMTMREALDHYQAQAVVDPKRRTLIVRDVKRAFRFQPALADVPANGHSVRFLLEKFAIGKTTQNIRSNVKALLKWVHDEIPRDRVSVTLSNEWDALLSSTALSRFRRFNLQRLARFCQGRQVQPSDVTDVVVATFYSLILKHGTVKDPRQLLRAIVSSWDVLIKSGHPSLHQLKLPRLTNLPQLTPSLGDMPDEVAAEITAVYAFMMADPAEVKRRRFDRRETSAGGPKKTRKKLAESSSTSYVKYYRRAVRTLDEDPDRDNLPVTLRDIVIPANMEFIMNTMSDELSDRNKGERSLHLMGCAILYLATHYFTVSESDLGEITRLYHQVGRPEPKMTVKNLRRLQSLVLTKRHELLRLPALLLSPAIKAIQAGLRTPRLLVDAQVAVAIAILLSIPIREKNLAAIRLDKHLRLSGQRGTAAHLLIPGEMVKNGLEIDRVVPVDVAELLRAYVKNVLPLLRSSAGSTALFPGRGDDSTRGPAGLGSQVSKRIKRHLGIEMNLHLFRHYIAMLYLEEHPGEYEVVRLLLGNKSLEIVKKFYAIAEQPAAHAKANRAVARLKLDAGLNPQNMLEVTKKPKRHAG